MYPIVLLGLLWGVCFLLTVELLSEFMNISCDSLNAADYLMKTVHSQWWRLLVRPTSFIPTFAILFHFRLGRRLFFRCSFEQSPQPPCHPVPCILLCLSFNCLSMIWKTINHFFLLLYSFAGFAPLSFTEVCFLSLSKSPNSLRIVFIFI